MQNMSFVGLCVIVWFTLTLNFRYVKLKNGLFAVYLLNITMNHLCVFSDHCLASALEQLSINAIIIAQSHSFHTKTDRT